MKWLTITIIALLLTISVIAQVTPPTPPADTSTVVIQKIDQEHKNTRKYFSDELTRQREQFTADIDDRANYYETTANNLINTATWKFGLIWAGITFFILSINSLLKTRIERKKYDKLKKALVGETTEQMMAQISQHQQNLDRRFQQIQAETQATVQNQFQKIQRYIAETQPKQPQQSYQAPVPPLMDYEGNPIRTAQQRVQSPKRDVNPPRVTFAELQELMRQYGLKPQESPMAPVFQEPEMPMPPPVMMPPAPRKLGFFERRKQAKLEKQLAYIQKLNAKRQNEEAQIRGELFKLNPFQ